MWYFPLLQPYVDHVPVKADLSDLADKIKWCRDHDAECKVIGENAKKFYDKYVSRSALLDYVEMCCKHISKRYVPPPAWWEPPPPEQPPPKLRRPDALCYEDRHTSRLCARCQEDFDAEQRELEAAQSAVVTERVDQATRKRRLKERMRKQARTKSVSS
jgi:hypothetical protein